MKFILITSIGLLILFSSCTSIRTTAVIPESQPILKSIQAETKTGFPAKEVEDPQGILTLEKAIQLALMQNPRLAVYSLEIRARDADALQASLFPNPEIEIETENFAGSGVYRGIDATETTISLGQLLELSGKREKRTKVAVFESDLAAWDYEALKLQVYTSVVRNYIQVLALQEKIELDKELLNISEKLVESVKKRVQSGGLSPAETARANVVVSNAEITLQRTERQLLATRSLLASTWNGKGLFATIQGSLEANRKIPEKDIIKQKLDQAPELARWSVEMERRRSSLELAEAMAVPDPTISLAYRRINESKDNALVAGLSIPLPFFDRNQGNVQKKQIRVKQGVWEKKTVRNNLNTRLESLYPNAEALAAEISALRQTAIPQAEKAFVIISESYQRGKFQLIDVLDAQRTLFEARRRLVDSLLDFKMTITELERLIGRDLQSL
ncbi:MAG: TolC family protein [Calditrichaeota bacterium]|nr:MAG: TolC family protein [Calditrichota bacterium]MBL1207170.1 TolC family protein [Calditrichota bacterium]NOG47002.1 TolC family protein [Calditrichota bacterium]